MPTKGNQSKSLGAKRTPELLFWGRFSFWLGVNRTYQPAPELHKIQHPLALFHLMVSHQLSLHWKTGNTLFGLLNSEAILQVWLLYCFVEAKFDEFQWFGGHDVLRWSAVWLSIDWYCSVRQNPSWIETVLGQFLFSFLLWLKCQNCTVWCQNGEGCMRTLLVGENSKWKSLLLV